MFTVMKKMLLKLLVWPWVKAF